MNQPLAYEELLQLKRWNTPTIYNGWDCEVEVFGCRVQPGQLIHADKHGFMAVPFGEEKGLLEASVFMDTNECKNLISVARSSTGKTVEQILKEIDEGAERFGEAAKKKFHKKGEW